MSNDALRHSRLTLEGRFLHGRAHTTAGGSLHQSLQMTQMLKAQTRLKLTTYKKNVDFNGNKIHAISKKENSILLKCIFQEIKTPKYMESFHV